MNRKMFELVFHDMRLLTIFIFIVLCLISLISLFIVATRLYL
jgi:hypothetical protein